MIVRASAKGRYFWLCGGPRESPNGRAYCSEMIWLQIFLQRASNLPRVYQNLATRLLNWLHWIPAVSGRMQIAKRALIHIFHHPLTLSRAKHGSSDRSSLAVVSILQHAHMSAYLLFRCATTCNIDIKYTWHEVCTRPAYPGPNAGPSGPLVAAGRMSYEELLHSCTVLCCTLMN